MKRLLESSVWSSRSRLLDLLPLWRWGSEYPPSVANPVLLSPTGCATNGGCWSRSSVIVVAYVLLAVCVPSIKEQAALTRKRTP